MYANRTMPSKTILKYLAKSTRRSFWGSFFPRFLPFLRFHLSFWFFFIVPSLLTEFYDALVDCCDCYEVLFCKHSNTFSERLNSLLRWLRSSTHKLPPDYKKPVTFFVFPFLNCCAPQERLNIQELFLIPFLSWAMKILRGAKSLRFWAHLKMGIARSCNADLIFTMFIH